MSRKPTLLSTPISIPNNKGANRTRNKSTFIAIKYVQSVVKLKQNFLNNIFQNFSNFFHLPRRYIQFHLRMLSKHLRADSNVSTDIWHFPGTINGYWKFILLCHLEIPNWNEVIYFFLILYRVAVTERSHILKQTCRFV